MSNTHRTALSFSRELEFATEAELAKRMGVYRRNWPLAAIKELIDNGLDACEEAGVDPVITVSVDGRTITVSDNGSGLSPELVKRLCIRSERTSSREAYAAPDRGAMGNALQTIMCLPLGYGLDEAVTTVISQGLRHTITLRVNRLAQRIDVEHVAGEHEATDGTSVTLLWPKDADEDLPRDLDRGELRYIIDRFAWLNPHAEFRFGGSTWEVTESVTKWTPGMPVPPHWYTSDRFAHRIMLELRRDPDITVAQFLGTFRGLSDRPRRSAVAAAAGLSYEPLRALVDGSGTALDQERARRLLTAMCAASKPPKPSALGGVGKEAFTDWADHLAANHGSGSPELLAYSTIEGVLYDTVPYRWEIGFAHIPGMEEAQHLLGQNFSPAMFPQNMLSAALPWGIEHIGDYSPTALFLHRITPARATSDYGKSGLILGHGESSALREAVERLAAPWIKQRARIQRKIEKQERERERPKPGEKPLSFKAAAFEAMADAYNAASSDGAFPVLSQQVFYQARPVILELMKREALKPDWRGRFCYTLLPEFMQANPKLTVRWQVLYKPRGDLTEPHTDKRIGLGTREVAAYRTGWTNGADVPPCGFDMPIWEVETHGPHHRYGAVLVVEKGGIADLCRMQQLDLTYDAAIVGNEGQSVEAELRLVEALGAVDVPVFVLADFDRQGFSIAENLRTGTWRHRYGGDSSVVHIGLRLDQIARFGWLASDGGTLGDEPIGEGAREHIGDDRLRECGATAEEIALLHDRRCELNALPTAQLVELIEEAFSEYGVAKIVPDADALVAAWRSAKAHAEIAEAVEEANKRAERWQDADVPEDLEERIRELLGEQPSMSWDAALRQIVEE